MKESWSTAVETAVETQVIRRKWRWLGHNLRKTPTRTVRQALRWNPQGQRKRGRPKTTRRRTVEAEGKQLGKTWGQLETLARDRRK